MQARVEPRDTNYIRRVSTDSDRLFQGMLGIYSYCYPLFILYRLDKEDTFHRDMERRKRRAERWGKPGWADGGFIHDEDWNFEIKKNQLLRRVPHHGVFAIGLSSSPRQRNSRRRRGSEL
jgi:hypothetical protein